MNMTRFYQLSNALVDTQEELRSILDHMDRRLRQASAVSIVISSQTSVSQPAYSKITFTTIDGSAMAYEQAGKNLRFVIDNKTRTLSKNLRYMAFTEPQTDLNTIISVSVTLEKSAYKGKTAALQMGAAKVMVMNP